MHGTGHGADGFSGYPMVAYRRSSFLSFSIDLVVRTTLFFFRSHHMYSQAFVPQHWSSSRYCVIPTCNCPNDTVPRPIHISFPSFFSDLQCCHSQCTGLDSVLFLNP